MTSIIFNVNKFTSYFGINFNEDEEYTHIYLHLVKGTYDLIYKVQSVLGEASLKCLQYYSIKWKLQPW